MKVFATNLMFTAAAALLSSHAATATPPGVSQSEPSIVEAKRCRYGKLRNGRCRKAPRGSH